MRRTRQYFSQLTKYAIGVQHSTLKKIASEIETILEIHVDLNADLNLVSTNSRVGVLALGFNNCLADLKNSNQYSDSLNELKMNLTGEIKRIQEIIDHSELQYQSACIAEHLRDDQLRNQAIFKLERSKQFMNSTKLKVSEEKLIKAKINSPTNERLDARVKELMNMTSLKAISN